MNNKKEMLLIEQANIMQEEQSIDNKNMTLDAWVQSHPFEQWNYSNKINKILVYYTSMGVIGAQISYRDPNKISITTGDINSSTATIEVVNFSDDEWLMQIKIVTSETDIPGITLCKNISFYTNKNLQGTQPKITIPPLSGNNAVKDKIYYANYDSKTWLEHKNIAESKGARLVCFQNEKEIDLAISEVNNRLALNDPRRQINNFYIGLYHINALIPNNTQGDANRNGNWKWVDNTQYNSFNSRWHSGEPNNWGYHSKRPGSGENVGMLYARQKTFNDIGKNARFPAIYQKKITDTDTQTLKKVGQHISSFIIKPLSVTYDTITSPDIAQRLNAEAAVDSTNNVTERIQETRKILDASLKEINDSIREVAFNIETTKSTINDQEELNAIGNKYLSEASKKKISDEQITSVVNDGFSNFLSEPMLNMREGHENGSFITANNSNQRNNALLTGSLLSELHAAEDKDKTNAISEFIIKRDNIFTNVLTDYMLNDERQNTFESVYNKIDQQNTDKMRKLEINTYYDKAYKEYINILKVIILACVILVPIVIANKNSMLPNSITNILVVVIIFLTIIYIITKLVDIYMRDNINFDKIRIPYDREAVKLQKDGIITKKKNLLSSFSLTCIGEDCCPDPSSGMIYDPTKNRCVANETFADYFDRPVGGYLDVTLNEYIDGSIDRLLGNTNKISIVQPFTKLTKEAVLGSTLRESDDAEMLK